MYTIQRPSPHKFGNKLWYLIQTPSILSGWFGWGGVLQYSFKCKWSERKKTEEYFLVQRYIPTCFSCCSLILYKFHSAQYLIQCKSQKLEQSHLSEPQNIEPNIEFRINQTDLWSERNNNYRQMTENWISFSEYAGNCAVEWANLSHDWSQNTLRKGT